jgi:hypothetical protein
VFTQAVVSSNWSGYVARRAAGGGFDAASGSWRMPRIVCSPGTGSSAAFWVGIGGFGVGSPSLQQLGGSADCSPAGAVSYRLWTEIVPSPPTFVSLRVGPGDLVSGSVSVAAKAVSFTLRNLTRGTRYTARGSRPRLADVSTAEWIAEAPSLCRTMSVCEVVPLSNFGTVVFTDVRASAGGAGGRLGTPGWRVTPVALVGSAESARYIASSNAFAAVPGPTSAAGRSFPVTFRHAVVGTPPAHPLPGAPVPAWVH